MKSPKSILAPLPSLLPIFIILTPSLKACLVWNSTQYWPSKWFWDMALYMLKHGRQTVVIKTFNTKTMAPQCIQTLVLTVDSKFINDLLKELLGPLYLSSEVIKYKLWDACGTIHVDFWFQQNHMNSEMHHKVVLANGVVKYTLVEAIPSFFPKMKATSFPSNLHLFPGNKGDKLTEC